MAMILFAIINLLSFFYNTGGILDHEKIEVQLEPDRRRLPQPFASESREIYSIRTGDQKLINGLQLARATKNTDESKLGIFTLWYITEQPREIVHIPILIDYSDTNKWLIFKGDKENLFDFSMSEVLYLYKDSSIVLDLILNDSIRHIFIIHQPSEGPFIKSKPKMSDTWQSQNIFIEFRKLNIYSSLIPGSDVRIGLIDKDQDGILRKQDDEIFMINKNDTSIDYLLGSSYSRFADVNYIFVNNRFYRIKLIKNNRLMLIDQKQDAINTQGILRIDSSLNTSLKFTTLDNQQKALSTLAKGKYLLINFWGIWCSPCVEKIPELKRIYLEYGNNLEILSLNYRDDIQDIVEFNNENDVQWSQGLRDETLSRYFGQNGYPFLILISPEGKILKNHISLIEVENLLKKN